MIKTQRIIKYLAIGLAIFLAINIIFAIMFGIISLGMIFTNDNPDIGTKLESLNITNNANTLDIEVKSVNVIIKNGSTLKAETDNKYIKLKQNNNKLSIIETKHNYFNKNDNTDLIIYIPTNHILTEVTIENGTGRIDIESMYTENLNLDLGAGKVNINNLTVAKSTDIDGGAGEVTIKNSSLNNLDLDVGVGKLTLESSITGHNDIDAGIGELNLNLIGSSSDYKIKVNKGIGTSTLNGETIKNDTYYGEGYNIINIDGGIGTISINYSR